MTLVIWMSWTLMSSYLNGYDLCVPWAPECTLQTESEQKTRRKVSIFQWTFQIPLFTMKAKAGYSSSIVTPYNLPSRLSASMFFITLNGCSGCSTLVWGLWRIACMISSKFPNEYEFDSKWGKYCECVGSSTWWILGRPIHNRLAFCPQLQKSCPQLSTSGMTVL